MTTPPRRPSPGPPDDPDDRVYDDRYEDDEPARPAPRRRRPSGRTLKILGIILGVLIGLYAAYLFWWYFTPWLWYHSFGFWGTTFVLVAAHVLALLMGMFAIKAIRSPRSRRRSTTT